MLKIMGIILMKLMDKGLTPIEINRFIKDVSNVISKGRCFTSTSIKQDIQSLGWEGHILDNRMMELIFMFLDDEERSDIYQYPIH